jgi:hypothetical protein
MRVRREGRAELSLRTSSEPAEEIKCEEVHDSEDNKDHACLIGDRFHNGAPL